MHRNIKALGLVLAAAFMLSAVTASAAMAVTHKFHSNANPTYLTAEADPTEGVQIFHGKAGDAKSIKCNKVNVNGTQSGTEVEAGTFAATEVTVEPIYTECGAYSGETKLANATVTSTGCHYTFTGETNAEEHAQVHIGHTPGQCEGGITVTVLGQVCIHIEPEQTVTGVHYTNITTGNGVKDITLKSTVTGIKSITTNHALVCPTESGGEETDSTGTYTGNVIVKGYKDTAHTEPANITVNP